MRIENLQQFSAYSVIGTVSFLPLLVLPAMVGVLVDAAASVVAIGHYQRVFLVAIALMIVSMAGFFFPVCKTHTQRAEVES
jgi:hypothetical protein